MLESTVIIAALGVVATAVTSLVWIVKNLFTQSNTTIKDSTKATEKLSRSIDNQTAASIKQTQALEHQERATKEWQQYVVTRFDAIENNTAAILGSVRPEVQVIEHQVINQKEK